MNTVELLFALLRAELAGKELSEDVGKYINEETATALYELSDTHDLAHIVGAALLNNGLLADDDVSQKFKKKAMLATYRHEVKEAELNSITDLFENEKMEYLQLKGQTIARFYPEPWMRTSCDIDILVNENELSRAKRLLCERLGYTIEDIPEVHDVSMHAPSGVHLELHFRMRESFVQLDKNLDDLREYTVKNSEREYSLSLTDEFLFYYVIVHTAYHFSRSGCGIRQILDLWFLEKNLEVSKDALYSLLNEIGLTTFYEKTKLLNSVWMEGGEHTPVTQKMEEFIIGSGIYGTHENYLLLEKEKSGDRKNYIFKRLFISSESMKNLYPILKKHPYLTPFLQIWRWVESVFNKKAQKALRELRAIKNTSQEKTNAITDIVKELGL